jgi:hypothetical protein
MKIKICASWTSTTEATKRVLYQFKTPKINLDDVEFVYDNSYDLIIFFNNVCEQLKEGSNAFIFPHEPSWTGTHQKVLSKNVTIFGFDKQIYTGNCIELLAHTFYGGRGDWVDPQSFWNYDFLSKASFTKSKNISCSITKLKENNGPTCLYPQRHKLAEFINNKFIDMYGGWLDNSPKRHDALVNYKFNISIENEHINNWITEKFYDCILTDTIPIYFGCKNIKEVYPEDGYILIEDINDVDGIEKMLKEIDKNSEDIYNQKLPGLLKIKEKYFAENNLLKRILNCRYIKY